MPQSQQALQQFFQGDDKVSYSYLQGLTFTLGACPVPVPVDEWLPLLWPETHQPAFASADEATLIKSALQSGVDAQSSAANIFWPDSCATETADAFAQWCDGMVAGHMWLDSLWEQIYPMVEGQQLQQVHDEVLSMAVTFANPEFGNQLREQQGKERLDPELLPVYRGAFNDLLQAYREAGATLREALANS